ncbi:hypothetical protein VYU27_005687 [Nannochloropsis oceanica]
MPLRGREEEEQEEQGGAGEGGEGGEGREGREGGGAGGTVAEGAGAGTGAESEAERGEGGERERGARGGGGGGGGGGDGGKGETKPLPSCAAASVKLRPPRKKSKRAVEAEPQWKAVPAWRADAAASATAAAVAAAAPLLPPLGASSTNTITRAQPPAAARVHFENFNMPGPPSTIDMATGRACTSPGTKWLAKTAAKEAVLGASNEARLIGTVAVMVQVSPSVLQGLIAAKKVETVTRVFQNPKRKMEMSWEKCSGEFSTPLGQLPLSRLLLALDNDKVRIPIKAHADMLETLWSLQNPQSSPWKRPLLRLCTTLTPHPSALLLDGRSSSKEQVNVHITFHVFVGRLIFELIANTDTQALMAGLTPVGHVIPAAQVPPSTNTFRKSPAPAAAAATAAASDAVQAVGVLESGDGGGGGGGKGGKGGKGGQGGQGKGVGGMRKETSSPWDVGDKSDEQESEEEDEEGDEVQIIADSDDDDSVIFIPPDQNKKKTKQQQQQQPQTGGRKSKGTGKGKAVVTKSGYNKQRKFSLGPTTLPNNPPSSTAARAPAPSAPASLWQVQRDYLFSLPGLLHQAESCGYPIRDAQPPGLAVQLFDFQRSTLQWMLDRERGPGLNQYFWEKRLWSKARGAGEGWKEEGEDDGEGFYYFPDAGELRLQRPPHCTGGLLCEEMGLGKTLECLSLVLANPLKEKETKGRQAAAAAARTTAAMMVGKKHGEKGEEEWEGSTTMCGKVKASLIVVPATLLSQWLVEIQKTTHPGAVDAVVFIGVGKASFGSWSLRAVTEEGWVGDAFKSWRDLSVGDVVWAPVCRLEGLEETETVAAAAAAAAAAAGAGGAGGEPSEAHKHKVRQQYYRARILKFSPCSYSSPRIELEYLYTHQAVGQADVVLTTYDTLRNHRGGRWLRQLHWHRVILDECQEIRTSTSMIAKLCSSLMATHRWMVSGTPLFVSIDDLHGELQFLKVSPFSLQNDGFWEAKIGQPWKKRSEGEVGQQALILLRLLISVCMMRHSKGQVYVAGGRPIVTMPERSVTWVPVEGMSGSERFCYGYLEVLAAEECRRLVEQALHAAAVGGGEEAGGVGGEGGGTEGGGAGEERGLLHSAVVGAVAAAAADSGGAGGGEGGGAVSQRVLTREEQAQVLAQAIQHGGEGRRTGRGRGGAAVGAHAKLKALLFMLQRVLLHPSLVSLAQLDSIKRSLQIQQRLLAVSLNAEKNKDSMIPILGIEEMLTRLQGRNAQGGLTRDVNRTWALHGYQNEEAREKLEGLTLMELRARVAKEGLPLPIAWTQLPLRAAVGKGEERMEVWTYYEEERGGREGGKGGRKMVDELLAVGDVIRIGMNDEDYENGVKGLAVEGGREGGGKGGQLENGVTGLIVREGDAEGILERGESGQVILEAAWANEENPKTVIYKRGPATRKKAYADLLMAKEKEMKGMTDQLHEAGFASIFAVLEGKDLNCPVSRGPGEGGTWCQGVRCVGNR